MKSALALGSTAPPTGCSDLSFKRGGQSEESSHQREREGKAAVDKVSGGKVFSKCYFSPIWILYLPDEIDDSFSRSRTDGFVVYHDDLITRQQLPLRWTTYQHTNTCKQATADQSAP